MLSFESVTAWLRDNGQTAAVEALLSDADEPAAAAAAAAAAVAPDSDHSSSANESSALNGGIGESAPSGFAKQSDPAPSESAPSEAPPDRPQVAPTFSPRLSLSPSPPHNLRLASREPRAAAHAADRCHPAAQADAAFTLERVGRDIATVCDEDGVIFFQARPPATLVRSGSHGSQHSPSKAPALP